MKKIVLALIFGIPALLFSQKNIPSQIILKLYAGGDYQDQERKGMFSNEDSLVYHYSSEYEAFFTNRIYQLRKIIMPVDSNFNKENINLDSTITLFTNNSVLASKIDLFLHWIKEEHYCKKVVEDTLQIKGISDILIKDTLLIPCTLSIKDFGIDTSNFKLTCEYFEKTSSSDIKCEEIDLSWLFYHLLGAQRPMSISSYFKSLKLRLIYEDKIIEIGQTYPGGLNIRWWIKTDEGNEFWAINPNLNKIVTSFIPYNLRSSWNLNEFKKKENVFEVISTSKN